MRVVLNEKGAAATYGIGGPTPSSLPAGTICIAEKNPNGYFRLTVEDTGDRRGLFREDEFTVIQDKVTESDKPKSYVDVVHFKPLQQIMAAFAAFNQAISNTEAGWLEVPEMIVLDEAGCAYARIFYQDGEALVEPFFNLVRDIEDR